MPYVTRNAEGKIVALLAEAPADGTEFLSPESVEVLQFVYGDAVKGEMAALDLEFIRVIEDVIDVLVQRNTLLYTDLSPAVQAKLNRRRQVRGGSPMLSMNDDDIIRL
ncbi:MAG: hypothetical protein PHX38_01715 [Sulfuricella sp.]|nr:hypothetical protein [Sulfuricella sp.]